jgi:hypothetical protein
MRPSQRLCQRRFFCTPSMTSHAASGTSSPLRTCRFDSANLPGPSAPRRYFPSQHSTRKSDFHGITRNRIFRKTAAVTFDATVEQIVGRLFADETMRAQLFAFPQAFTS